MFSFIKNYFAEFDKEDWEYLSYLVVIVLMLALLPAVLFWDYLQSPTFRWEWLKWSFFLTETLRNWWV